MVGDYVYPINPYQIDVVEEHPKLENDIIVYADLTDDGNSEQLFFRKKESVGPTLIVRESGKIWEQWNFKEEFARDQFYHIGDLMEMVNSRDLF